MLAAGFLAAGFLARRRKRADAGRVAVVSVAAGASRAVGAAGLGLLPLEGLWPHKLLAGATLIAAGMFEQLIE